MIQNELNPVTLLLRGLSFTTKKSNKQGEFLIPPAYQIQFLIHQNQSLVKGLFSIPIATSQSNALGSCILGLASGQFVRSEVRHAAVKSPQCAPFRCHFSINALIKRVENKMKRIFFIKRLDTFVYIKSPFSGAMNQSIFFSASKPLWQYPVMFEISSLI